MGKQAGFLKRLKNTVGKGISTIASKLNKFVNTSKPLINRIPVVGTVVSEVADRVTNSANQFGRMLQGQITGKQFGNHIVDTYKSGALVAPYRAFNAVRQNGIQGLGNEMRAQYQDAMSYLDTN